VRSESSYYTDVSGQLGPIYPPANEPEIPIEWTILWAPESVRTRTHNSHFSPGHIDYKTSGNLCRIFIKVFHYRQFGFLFFFQLDEPNKQYHIGWVYSFSRT
jgi:hypothetical protein